MTERYFMLTEKQMKDLTSIYYFLSELSRPNQLTFLLSDDELRMIKAHASALRNIVTQEDIPND